MKELSLDRIWLANDESPEIVSKVDILKENISDKKSNRIENS